MSRLETTPKSQDPLLYWSAGRNSFDAGIVMTTASLATLADLDRLDIRVGRVLEARPFPEGRYSTHVLKIDFGVEVGLKTSLAKLAPNYAGDELIGRLVLAVVNLPARQIGKHLSEVLTLGVPDSAGNVVLVTPEDKVPIGARLH